MVSGINGNSGLYGYQSALNQIRLAQIMNSKGNETSQSVAKTVTKQSESLNKRLSGSMNYVTQFSSAMTDLMSSANSLRNTNSASIVSKLTLDSSDTSILTAENRYRLNSKTSYEIEISQLATAQTNLSDGVSSSSYGSDVSMELLTSKGITDISVSATDEKGNQKTNLQVLSETAKKINGADTGLKATVLTENGISRLKIESTQTGENGRFSVSGDFADQNGMSNITQSGQNASYTVTQNGISKSYTSENNQATLDFGNINITMKKEGKATLTVGTDPDQYVSAMEKLVNSYNNVVSLLNKNTDRGDGAARQLSKLGRVMGSLQTMELLGLSKDKDGMISLDKTKLADNLKDHTDLTKDLISGSFGLAQKAFNSAQSGLNTSISSMISNDLKDAEYERLTSPVNFMSSYSRSGAYNMMNYYASGLLYSMMI